MTIPGYKQTLEYDGKEHTPATLRQEIRELLKGTRISQQAYFKIMELVGVMEAWLDTHVGEEWQPCETCDAPFACDSKGCARLDGLKS